MKRHLPQNTSWRKLLAMTMTIAVPVAFQNLLTTTGSMIDTIMLGSIGETAVGAVGLCAQFSNLMFAGYWGFVGGGMLFISQYYGAKNEDGLCASYGLMISCMAVPALLFAMLAICFPQMIMAMFTGSAEIRAIGEQYLRLVGFAYPFQVLATGMSALLRSIGMVTIPLAAGIAGVAVNCTVNYLLIFGKLGLPAMGASGAAVGTIAAGMVNVLILILTAKIMKTPYLLEVKRHFRWNHALVKDYLVKCSPIIANEALIGIGNALVSIVLGHQSDAAIAATAVFRTLEGMIISFFSGFSSAATVLVGTEVGAGRHEEAGSRAWRIIYICQMCVLCVCLTLVAVHRTLLTAMGLSGESFKLARGMLVIFVAVGTIRMGNWAQNDTYRAAGDSATGSIMEIAFMFLLVQPVIQSVNFFLNVPFLVLFALCYCDEPIRYFLMQRHMYSYRWIRPVSKEGMATINAFRKRYGIEGNA